MDHLFEVGETYRNRNGFYEVLAIEEPKMRIRYEDGLEQEVTIDIQTRIWEAIIDEELAAAAKSPKKRRKPSRPSSIAGKEKVTSVMLHKTIPAGQMRLYKAMWDRGNCGLTLTELAEATHSSSKEAASTLGALGNRVTQVLGDHDNSRLIVERWSGYYYLSPEMLGFIEATPSFNNALDTSEQSMFDLHSPTAWRFIWNEGGQSGYLEEFTRPRSK